MLKLYSAAFTTRVVGLAAEECGRLSYHLDQEFDKDELNDPDFPVNTSSDFKYDYIVNPVDILTDVCGAGVEKIVVTIGRMEERWVQAGFRGHKDLDDNVAQKLWNFVKDTAKHHVECLYGEEYGEEFYRIGHDLFEKNKQ